MEERDDDLRSLEELQRQIRRELDHLEVELAPVFGGIFDDPAESIERFERSAGRLETSLTELGEALSGLESVAPIDLSRIAARLLQDMLLGLEKPLVIEVHWQDDLPRPVVSGEPLRSLLQRVFDLVGRFSQAGDTLRVGTEAADGDAVLRVAVLPGEPSSASETAAQLRIRGSSLDEFVQDLGGRFDLAVEPRRIELSIRLPVVASPR